MITKLKALFERNRTHQQLSRLSDRELRDIGLSRGDISFVVRNGCRPVDDVKLGVAA